MMKAFKTFFKDYGTLCKQTGAFNKRHWKGNLVMSTAVMGVEAAWIFRKEIKDKISNKIESKKSKEEGVQ